MQNLIFYLCAVLLAAGLAHAQEDASPAESQEALGVFETYANRIVQVRVIEKTSGVKSSLGSGFYISEEGEIITNYHVVSSRVFEPDRYQIEVLDHEQNKSEVELAYVDVVHDLAILRSKQKVAHHIVPSAIPLSKGEQVYSFGNPHDLGLIIVEGIYNGFVENARYEKIHYTGSINSGMSGGPAITSNGQLVGVNVSSMGEQVSFLVPAKFVVNMLEDYNKSKAAGPLTMLKLVERQLVADQELTFANLLSKKLPSVDLGTYEVPSKLVPSLKCWSNSKTLDERRYSYVNHQCSFSDSIYLTNSFYTGSFYVFYNLVTGDTLNRFQFSALVEEHLASYGNGEGGSEEDVSNFKCVQDFVDTKNNTMWVNACFRIYKRMPSLYDVALVSASLNDDSRSLLSYVRAKGVSFPNAQKLMKSVLRGIAWKPS